MATPGSPPKRPPPPPPARRGPRAPIALGPDPAPVRGPGKFVLVVDDDQATRDLVIRTLSKEFRMCGAASGEEALALIESSGVPDAAIIDVMMPGMDGFELARRIKARADCARAPVMFLTARDASADVVAGIKAGARHYVTKPFKLDDLLEKVRRMVKS